MTGFGIQQSDLYKIKMHAVLSIRFDFNYKRLLNLKFQKNEKIEKLQL